VKWRPNYTYSSIITFTAQHEHFITVHDVLNKTGFAERFERLGHTDLLRLYLHGVPDAPIALSVAIFNAVDEFLKCCNRFEQSSVFVLRIIYVFFSLLVLYFESST